MTPDPQVAGQRTSGFHPDRPAQVTQTAGVNPDPPARRSLSVPADAPPVTSCVFGIYAPGDDSGWS